MLYTTIIFSYTLIVITGLCKTLKNAIACLLQVQNKLIQSPISHVIEAILRNIKRHKYSITLKSNII